MTTSRRALVVGATLALSHSPAAVAAQTGKVPRIGLLETGSLAGRAPLLEAFREAMRDLGYIEGQTAIFETRGDGDESKRLATLAAELVPGSCRSISRRSSGWS